MTSFWTGDLTSTITAARGIKNPEFASPHLEAWLSGYDERAMPSSNAGSYDLPFQRWMKFKEGFSPKFVVDAIRAMPHRPRRCVDPFGGSGTTALTCAFLGIEAVTIEVNPFLADLIQAKLAPPTSAALTDAYSLVLANARAVDRGTVRRLASLLPPTFREPGVAGRFVYDREVLKTVLSYRHAIEKCGEPARTLLRVLLGSILVAVSNVVVNGKGRRYRGGWQRRQVEPSEVDALFAEAVGRAARDLSAFGARRRAVGTLVRGDSRVNLAKVGPVDAAIFSPPYPNSFDYTDIYNLELWTLGYMDSEHANRRLRQATVRSHVQVTFNKPRAHASRAVAAVVDDLASVREKLWDPRIPEMVGGYFEDIETILRSLHAVIRPKGRAVLVVGDSRYAGVHIDVAVLLNEIADRVGFRLVSSEAMRSMRSSAQHGGQHNLAETCLVFER